MTSRLTKKKSYNWNSFFSFWQPQVTLEAQLGLIGGTMGLLTGFSILSGVEIIYYLLRLGNAFHRVTFYFTGSSCLSRLQTVWLRLLPTRFVVAIRRRTKIWREKETVTFSVHMHIVCWEDDHKHISLFLNKYLLRKFRLLFESLPYANDSVSLFPFSFGNISPKNMIWCWNANWALSEAQWAS